MLVSALLNSAAIGAAQYGNQYDCVDYQQDCPADYTKSQDNKCVKETTSQVASQIKQECPEGYHESNYKCVKAVTTVEYAAYSLSCYEGYGRTKTRCVQKVYSQQYAEMKQECPEGYSEIGGKCAQAKAYPVSERCPFVT
jgi:hypothetical protein